MSPETSCRPSSLSALLKAAIAGIVMLRYSEASGRGRKERRSLRSPAARVPSTLRMTALMGDNDHSVRIQTVTREIATQSRESLLAQFVHWAATHITGDEKGQAQIFLDRLFRAFGQKGSLDVGGTAEMRIRKASEDGGRTSFADYVWKPVVP